MGDSWVIPSVTSLTDRSVYCGALSKNQLIVRYASLEMATIGLKIEQGITSERFSAFLLGGESESKKNEVASCRACKLLSFLEVATTMSEVFACQFDTSRTYQNSVILSRCLSSLLVSYLVANYCRLTFEMLFLNHFLAFVYRTRRENLGLFHINRKISILFLTTV